MPFTYIRFFYGTIVRWEDLKRKTSLVPERFKVHPAYDPTGEIDQENFDSFYQEVHKVSGLSTFEVDGDIIDLYLKRSPTLLPPHVSVMDTCLLIGVNLGGLDLQGGSSKVPTFEKIMESKGQFYELVCDEVKAIGGTPNFHAIQDY